MDVQSHLIYLFCVFRKLFTFIPELFEKSLYAIVRALKIPGNTFHALLTRFLDLVTGVLMSRYLVSGCHEIALVAAALNLRL